MRMYDAEHRERMHEFLKQQMAASGGQDLHARTPDLDEVAVDMGSSPREASALFGGMRGTILAGHSTYG